MKFCMQMTWFYRVKVCAKCGKRVMENSMIGTKCNKLVHGGCAK